MSSLFAINGTEVKQSDNNVFHIKSRSRDKQRSAPTVGPISGVRVLYK